MDDDNKVRWSERRGEEKGERLKKIQIQDECTKSREQIKFNYKSNKDKVLTVTYIHTYRRQS